MKKNIFYVLILIVMWGMLSPVAQAQSQPAGTCVWKRVISPATPAQITAGQNLVRIGNTTYLYEPVTIAGGGVTQQYCRTSTGGAFLSWTQIPGRFITPTSPLPTEPRGTCTFSTGLVVTNVTEPQCAGPQGTIPGTWNAGAPQEPGSGQKTSLPYQLLVPFINPDDGTSFTEVPVKENNALGLYLNIMIKIAIGLAAVLAMVMIVMGGIQYMTSELAHSKESGKNKITNAILGLLVALGAWLILFTINPDLLDTDVAIETTVINYAGSPESSVPFSPATGATLASLQALGITCDASLRLEVIAASFLGKSTYDMDKRNMVDANTAYFDCSSYVAQVYACKGLPSPGSTTLAIFGGSGVEQIRKQQNGALDITIDSRRVASINGVPLKIGDLIGWTGPSSGRQFGHVLMYIGGGRVIDSRFGTAFNQGVNISDLSQWADDPRLKFIKRLP